MLTNDFQLVPLAAIVVNRAERQRRKVDTTGLRDSIQRNGLINPIVVTREMVLVAGERRLTACTELGHVTIAVRFAEDLSPFELSVIELEENLKRTDLSWQDEAQAIAKLHELYSSAEPGWSQAKTAQALSMAPAQVSTILRVVKEFADPRIAGATGLQPAYNIIQRADERRIGDAMGDIVQANADIFAERLVVETGGLVPTDATVAIGKPVNKPILAATPVAPPESILNTSFLDWAPQYTGPRFSFIHCDFPYGMNVFGGAMSGRDKWNTYSDTPDTYWDLIRCLCLNLDRVMSPSAHLMFWFSMEHYEATRRIFRDLAPSLVFSPFPLLWQKSDNVGILPDSNRGPRRIYETAMVASREDRFIVKPVSNAIAAPTDKAHHPSAKPVPVLKHFFQMYVDENTTLLDPTCGGASALIAAEALGAKRVAGCEMDKEHCANGRSALRQFRSLRAAAQVVYEKDRKDGR